MQKIDFCHLDGVVSVSGDGLFHEIVNGLMGRADWEQLKDKISLGIIPGGTSNGLVKSLLDLQDEQYGTLEAAWLVIKGHKKLIDITKLSLEYEPKPIFSFLSVSWAVIADCDINSEVIRSLGSARFTLWGVWRVLALVRYEATFQCEGFQIKNKNQTTENSRLILFQR